MRLPYIQVTQETWDHARSLAALTGVDLGRAFMAVCDLYRWGVSLGPDDKPPEGICDSPRAPRLLAAALGWAGDADELVTALADLGLVERLEVGLRVRGTDRYREAFERQQANRQRWRRANERRRNPQAEQVTTPPPQPDREVTARSESGDSAETLRKTQTQTQTQTQIPPPSEVVDAPPPDEVPEDPPAKERRLLISEDPPTCGEAFFAWARDQRAEALGLPRERPPNGGRGLSAWFSQAMLEVGGDVRRLQAAYRAFLGDAHWRGAAPACPWAGWVAQWERFVPPVAPDARLAELRDAMRARFEPALGGYMAGWLVNDSGATFREDGMQLVVVVSDSYQADDLRAKLAADATVRVEYQPQAEGAAA